MTMENTQPDEALELSPQELDDVAGGATTDVFGRNLTDDDKQLGFVEFLPDGGIRSVTLQQSFFSEQELNERKQTGASSPEVS